LTLAHAFGDLDADGAQLTVNPWRSPQRVRCRHFTDESADLRIDRWTAFRLTLRTSGQSAAKPVAMSAHDGVRLHQHQRHAPVPPASRQGDPKQSVARPEMGSLGRASQGRQLLPKSQVFQDQLPMSRACQRQPTDDEDEQLQHASMVAAVAAKFTRKE
jgi:hypothetical protein